MATAAAPAFTYNTAPLSAAPITSTPGADRLVATTQATALTLTQSGSLAIQSTASVSCNAAGRHTDNSYYRRLDLSGSFSISRSVAVTSVDIGIEAATGNGGSQPITVKLYALAHGATLTVANLGAPIGSASVSVANQSLSVLNVPVTGTLHGASSDLVIEVFTPNGQTAGNNFFIGSNNTASINPSGAPSFIRAPDCGVAEPVEVASIGYPNMNIVMVANAILLPTVGGTVAGLTGTGLQLQINGGETLAISSNGAYQFPMGRPLGSNYAVTVGQQPSNQQCSVSNANGSNIQDDVGNVDVQCLTQQSITFTSTIPANAKVGESYTVTATGGMSGNPVTFSIDASSASICSIAGSMVSFDATGNCVINANQLGNTQYIAAAQAQQAITVSQASSTVLLTSSQNPSQPGQAVTFTVSVALSQAMAAGLQTQAAALPSGTIQLTDNGTVLGTATLVNGSASLTTTQLTTVGSHSIVANYSGDTNYAAATSAAFLQVVVSPAAVPTLGQWALMLLSALLAACAAMGLLRTRM